MQMLAALQYTLQYKTVSFWVFWCYFKLALCTLYFIPKKLFFFYFCRLACIHCA